MEDRYIIKGSTKLVGEVTIGGAKNAALAILAAAVLSDEASVIENLPHVSDISVLLKAIEQTGAKVTRIDNHTVKISGKSVTTKVIDYDFIRKIRASYYLLGALLGKYKKAEVALPGGCNIGNRPIDQHIKGFEALGATVKLEHGMINATADKLVGANIYLDVVSVGATINIILASVLAEGTTIIENAAKEPHIVDVANFLNSMGAEIKGAGTDLIKINGVSKLHGTQYAIIPDQIEAGTFMVAAAATGGNIEVKNIIPKHMEAVSAKLIEMGATVIEGADSIRVIGGAEYKATNIKTLPYPGFPTDMQPQMTVALCLAQGTSIITEGIWENRFKYVDELVRMGASIKVEGNTAIIEKTSKFTGAAVTAPDLRAGAALVVAGIIAEGFTVVDRVDFIERGYENFVEKLKNLGAQIERISTDKEEQKFRLKKSS